MQNNIDPTKQKRGGLHQPGEMLKEFFAWLSGFRSPQYVPQRIKYGSREGKILIQKSDFEHQTDHEGRWQDDGGNTVEQEDL